MNEADAAQQPLLSRIGEFAMTNEQFTMINHGAFGGALRCAIEAKNHFEHLQESNPYEFKLQSTEFMRESRRAVEDLVGAESGSIALIPNVTLGLNAAINSLIHSDDLVAFLDVVYGSTFQMLEKRCDSVAAEAYAVALIPLLPDNPVLSCDRALTKYIEEQIRPGTTCIVIDHITSSTAMELPIFTHILPMLARKGITKTIVDGAHGPFQCNMDLGKAPSPECPVLPAIYTGNLHKWLCVPKSVGFIFARHDIRAAMHAPPVGDEVVEFSDPTRSLFAQEFEQTFSSLNAAMTVPSVIRYWKSIGFQRVQEYCRSLIVSAQAILTDGFVAHEVVARRAPNMCLVPLDKRLRPPHYTAKFLQDVLHFDFGIEVPIKDVGGRLYVRLSAMVYNTPADYETLRHALHRFTSQILRTSRAEIAKQIPLVKRSRDAGCSGAVASSVAKKTARLEVDAL
jgi:selenocysteine lyase/cysteine desulfurase